MTTMELLVLGAGLTGILALYGLLFYDMYKQYKSGKVVRGTAEEESTLGLVEDDEE